MVNHQSMIDYLIHVAHEALQEVIHHSIAIELNASRILLAP